MFVFLPFLLWTQRLVSILDLALKFNCSPLLVLEAKRKLFGGNVFGLFVFWEVCVCAAVPVSAEKQNQALPPWQVKSA